MLIDVVPIQSAVRVGMDRSVTSGVVSVGTARVTKSMVSVRQAARRDGLDISVEHVRFALLLIYKLFLLLFVFLCCVLFVSLFCFYCLEGRWNSQGRQHRTRRFCFVL